MTPIFIANIATNEREISSLLEYFSKRVQAIFAHSANYTQTSEKYQACLNIFRSLVIIFDKNIEYILRSL